MYQYNIYIYIYIYIYGCFLKWWYPQNTSKWSFLVGKPIVVGYHHFRKPPYICIYIYIYIYFFFRFTPTVSIHSSNFSSAMEALNCQTMTTMTMRRRSSLSGWADDAVGAGEGWCDVEHLTENHAIYADLFFVWYLIWISRVNWWIVGRCFK